MSMQAQIYNNDKNINRIGKYVTKQPNQQKKQIHQTQADHYCTMCYHL
jgi:hypothetical protein